MSVGMLFWIIMIIWLVFWLGAWAEPRIGPFSGFVCWICLALLGWHVFGAAIHG